MPRTKWTPQQVNNWANQGQQGNGNGNSGGGGSGGGGSGNTIGNPAQGGPVNNGQISTFGLNKGVNLKSTDPQWKDHIHDVLSQLGNVPVVGGLFNAVNAGIYAGEGNVAGALEEGTNALMDLVPGGGEVSSSVKMAEGAGEAAEKAAVKATERAAENQAEKQGEKQAAKQGEKQAIGEDGGNVDKPKKQSCKNSNGVGHPVNPVTGVKFLDGAEDLDFTLSGVLPLRWQRSYFSDLLGNGWLGQGWSLPFSLCLKRIEHEVVLIDPQGNEVSLPALGAGEARRMGSIGFEVRRETHARFRLTSIDGSVQYAFSSLAVGEDDRTGDDCKVLPLVSIGDRHGNHLRLLYDDAGYPVTIHDAAGHVLQLQYLALAGVGDEGVRRMRRVMLGTRALVSYEYSPEGDLVRVRDAEERITREYRYNNHILIEHSQPGALVARYEYDRYVPGGKVTRQENNLGQAWQFRYLPGRTEVSDVLGRTSSYLFDESGVVVSLIDAAGNTTRIDVDSRGNPVRVTDPAGRVRQATYDARGNMTSLTDAAGGRSEFQYHPQWQQPTLVRDATGAVTRLEYDEIGNLVRRTDALGHATEYGYNGAGQLVRITDAHGKHRYFEYDLKGQLTSHTDCSGQATRYSRDEWGHPASETNAAGETTRYQWSRKGELLKIERADGSCEAFAYDVQGRMVAHTDALGACTQWERAADGLPVRHVNALGHPVSFEYDAARRLCAIVNENGARYRFAYDAAGRLVEEQGFDGRLTRYGYDASGRLLHAIELGTLGASAADGEDPPGTIRTSFARDAAGRLKSATITRAGDGSAEQITWQYDAAGRLVEASNDCCRLERGYDALGQLIRETTHVEGRTLTLSYEHDALGNHIRTTLPDGRGIDYLFYGPHHVHQVSIDGEVISDIERDGLHRETSRTQGRIVSHYGYDRVGRLVTQHTSDPSSVPSIGSAPAVLRIYGYDAAGNVLEVSGTHGNARRYRYDLIGQLIQADHEVFAFDPAHNILDGSDGGPVAGNRLEQFADVSYAYDTHGNIIEKTVGTNQRIEFEYSLLHRLARANITRGGTTQQVEYGYDALGRRAYRKEAAGVTLFAWESNRLLGEMRDEGTFVYVYAHNSFVPLAQIEWHADSREGKSAPAAIRYYHTDQIGTPLELTGADGRRHWRGRYEAWGRTQSEERVDGVHQPLRFQGQYFDAETGLHYNQHRYYDPDTGRFITQDPIGLRGDINLYRYAPNPTRWIDPLGLQGVGDGLANRTNLGNTVNQAGPNSPYVAAVGCINQGLQQCGVGLSDRAFNSINNNVQQVSAGNMSQTSASMTEAGVFARETASNLAAGNFGAAAISAAGSVINGVGSTLYLANYDREKLSKGQCALYDSFHM